jgi:hypothetical protein
VLGPHGKILRRCEGAQGELGNQGTSTGKNLIGEPAVFPGIQDIYTGTKYGDCLALGRYGPAMAGGIYASCHAALNY